MKTQFWTLYIYIVHFDYRIQIFFLNLHDFTGIGTVFLWQTCKTCFRDLGITISAALQYALCITLDNIWPIWPQVLPFWPWKCLSFFSWFLLCLYSHVTANAPNPPPQRSAHDGTRARAIETGSRCRNLRHKTFEAFGVYWKDFGRRWNFALGSVQLITGKTSGVSWCFAPQRCPHHFRRPPTHHFGHPPKMAHSSHFGLSLWPPDYASLWPPTYNSLLP